MARRVGKLAHRYARALLRVLAKGTEGSAPAKSLESEAHALSAFSGAWSQHEELRRVVSNPRFPKEKRLASLLAVGRLVGLRGSTLDFLSLVFERERIGMISEISDAFEEIADRASGVLHLEVATRKELSPEEKTALERAFSEGFSGKPRVSWRVDPHLIGGMLVGFEGKIFDASVCGQLDRIKRELITEGTA